MLAAITGVIMNSNNLTKLQPYENVNKFREMSAVEFCEYMGIELLPYQKIMLCVLERIYE